MSGATGLDGFISVVSMKQLKGEVTDLPIRRRILDTIRVWTTG